MDRNIIEPFSIKDNEINFKTKDVWNALNTQNGITLTQINL